MSKKVEKPSNTDGKRSKQWSSKSGNRKYKSKKRFSEGKDSRQFNYEPKNNNPDWYVSDEQMKRDIARIPFSYAAGKKYLLGTTTVANPLFQDGAPIDFTSHVVTPGAMVYYLRPSLPVTLSLQDPVNQAGTKLVAYLRHTLSAKLDVEGPDVMAMLIAMAQAYSYLNFATRLYAMPSMISNLNRYTPQALIASMGVNPTSLIGNLSRFRSALNQQIRRLSSLSVPNDIKYFPRTASLYANIYTGGTAIQDQLYYYTPAGFWMYKEDENGAGLRYEPWLDEYKFSLGGDSAVLLGWEDVIRYGNKMLEALFNSEDIITISALILRAYGTERTLKLALLQDEAQITPVFDIGILEQMANATVLGAEAAQYFADWDVNQEVDQDAVVSGLSFAPCLRLPASMFYSSYQTIMAASITEDYKHVLNTTTAFTGEDLVLESTRLMFNTKRLGAGGSGLKPTAATATWELQTSTEVVTGCTMLTSANLAGITQNTYGVASSYYTTVPFHLWLPMNSLADGTHHTYMTSLRSLVSSMKFKFSPRSYIGGVFEPTGEPYGETTLVWDLDNYALIDSQTLNSINEAATYALFNVNVISSAYRS